jgi:uncharacterized protein (DUF169 family)
MTNLKTTLGLSKEPIAVGFLEKAPAGVPQWNGGPVPAGCYFWREAMNGNAFYTVPSDHYNCAVGCYTHNISLSADRNTALNDTIGFMVTNGYLQMTEVPLIPVLPKTPRYVAYGPLTDGRFRADAVVVAAKPAQMMLIYEAALRAGAGTIGPPALGRPGCAVLPMALNSGSASFSFGCKGNRTFTGLPDEEMYLAVPAEKWNEVIDAVHTITAANATMEAHYKRHEAAVKS